MSDWKVHGYRPCNVYKEEDEEKEKNAQEEARARLKRYLFFANRYMAHQQSLKFEHKLYDQVKKKMVELQQKHAMSWVEVSGR